MKSYEHHNRNQTTGSSTSTAKQASPDNSSVLESMAEAILNSGPSFLSRLGAFDDGAEHDHTSTLLDGFEGSWETTPEGVHHLEGHQGIDVIQDGLRIQALDLGGDAQIDPSSSQAPLQGEFHATGMGVSADPSITEKAGIWGGLRALDVGGIRTVDAEVSEHGARADLLSGEVGYREVNKEKNTDRGFRLGGSVGLKSGGIRLYNQDLDNDGHPELGVGFAAPVGVGGFSADRTSETPLGDLLILGTDALVNQLSPLPTMGLLPALNESVEGMTKDEVSPSREIHKAMSRPFMEAP